MLKRQSMLIANFNFFFFSKKAMGIAKKFFFHHLLEYM